MAEIISLVVSPRKKGTSTLLANILGEKKLSLFHDKEIIPELLKAETIVILGPCYINSFPGELTSLLEDLSLFDLQGKHMYGVIQGGMPTLDTHRHGVMMLEQFCKTKDMNYMGSFIFGGGPIVDGKDLSNMPGGKKVEGAYKVFCEHVKNKTYSPDSLFEEVQPSFNKPLLWGLAKMMNFSINRTLKMKGFDPYQKSPYTERGLLSHDKST